MVAWAAAEVGLVVGAEVRVGARVGTRGDIWEELCTHCTVFTYRRV